MNLKFKNFQNTLLKNSETVDNFIKKLPKSEGLNKKLIEAIKYAILGVEKNKKFSLMKQGKLFQVSII